MFLKRAGIAPTGFSRYLPNQNRRNGTYPKGIPLFNRLFKSDIFKLPILSDKFPTYVVYTLPEEVVIQNTANKLDRTIMSRDGVSLVSPDPITKTLYYIKRTNGINAIHRDQDGTLFVQLSKLGKSLNSLCLIIIYPNFR